LSPRRKRVRIRNDHEPAAGQQLARELRRSSHSALLDYDRASDPRLLRGLIETRLHRHTGMPRCIVITPSWEGCYICNSEIHLYHSMPCCDSVFVFRLSNIVSKQEAGAGG
jgi:hypothetical protein